MLELKFENISGNFHILVLSEAFIFSQVQITEDVRQYLRKPTFDNWQWDDSKLKDHPS